MQEITVLKSMLLETLEKNRGEHREIFEKAQVAYRDAMVAELDRALEEARNGGQIKRAFSLPVPEDHTEDFDTAIAMLGWEVEDQVVLQQHEFQQYVLNEWGWQRSFLANTQSYVAG